MPLTSPPFDTRESEDDFGQGKSLGTRPDEKNRPGRRVWIVWTIGQHDAHVIHSVHGTQEKATKTAGESNNATGVTEHEVL